MKVTLLASTYINPEVRGSYSGRMGKAQGIVTDDEKFRNSNGPYGFTMETDPDASEAEDLIEFAGRSCYQSFHKPNSATRKNSDYIANIVAQGHHSVLEHASATFYIEGVSRALTHELIRHRHLSFSELSQRFVNVEDAEFIKPPAMRDLGIPGGPGPGYSNALVDSIRAEYAELVRYLEEDGRTRKQAREAARAVMPNATETKIVVTGNHRAWRDAIGKRYSTHADAEIRELATELLRQLREIAPAVYADFPEVPFS